MTTCTASSSPRTRSAGTLTAAAGCAIRSAMARRRPTCSSPRGYTSVAFLADRRRAHLHRRDPRSTHDAAAGLHCRSARAAPAAPTAFGAVAAARKDPRALSVGHRAQRCQGDNIDYAEPNRGHTGGHVGPYKGTDHAFTDASIDRHIPASSSRTRRRRTCSYRSAATSASPKQELIGCPRRLRRSSLRGGLRRLRGRRAVRGLREPRRLPRGRAAGYRSGAVAVLRRGSTAAAPSIRRQGRGAGAAVLRQPRPTRRCWATQGPRS